MIDQRKKYMISIFLKRCNFYDTMKAHLNFSTQLMEQRYDISEAKAKELKEKYSADDYVERVTPSIDEQFTMEELEEAIKFFSMGAGKKMADKHFLQKIRKAEVDMVSQAEREYALNDK